MMAYNYEVLFWIWFGDQAEKKQRMLNKLYHWGLNKNLQFNLTKTVAVLFSKKHKPKHGK